MSLPTSGFLNRPTYMPKDRFDQEKKILWQRIQALIAQGESITRMMEVPPFPRFHLERQDRRRRLAGKTPPKKGVQKSGRRVPKRLQGAGYGLPDVARATFELQGQQPAAARVFPPSRDPRGYRLPPLAAPARPLRIPAATRRLCRRAFLEFPLFPPRAALPHSGGSIGRGVSPV